MPARIRFKPLPEHACLKLDNWLTWGGSMIRTEDGICHLYFSRWPRELRHEAWVTHSEVAYATATDPLGPYQLQKVVLGKRAGEYWDADVAHNPTILRWKNKFYLYYTGNYGNGDYWVHRNNQRIGVAVADHPAGPWNRYDQPLLDVSPGKWDSLITTNPSCTITPDGRFLLMYKGAGKEDEPPMYGPVLHGVAFADHPVGPFIKHPDPIFQAKGVSFPGEDPFVWYQDGCFYAILKDMGQNYSKYERALVLFKSLDGLDWQLTENPVVSTRQIMFESNQLKSFYRLERPQLYRENGQPAVLFCAAKLRKDKDDSYNIQIPLA